MALAFFSWSGVLIRRVLLTSASILLVLIALLAAVAWWGSQEGTLRWLLERGAHQAQLQIQVHGLRGSVWRGVSIESLQLQHTDWRLQLQQLRLHWFYWPGGGVRIPRLRIQNAEWQLLRTRDEPPKLPTRLALPFEIIIDKVMLDRLQWRSASGAQAEVHDIEAQIRLGSQYHAFEVQQARVDQWQMQADIHLQTDAPFDLQAQGQLISMTPDTPWKSVNARAQGSLSAVQIQARVQWRRASDTPVLEAEWRIKPFEKDGIAPLYVRAMGIPNAWWGATQRQAEIDAEAWITWHTARPQVQMQIRNQRSGPWDANKLPFEILQARWTPMPRRDKARNDWTAWQTDSLAIDAAGGRTTGQAQVVLQPTLKVSWQIQAERVQAARVNSKAGAAVWQGRSQGEWSKTALAFDVQAQTAGLRIQTQVRRAASQAWHVQAEAQATQWSAQRMWRVLPSYWPTHPVTVQAQFSGLWWFEPTGWRMSDASLRLTTPGATLTAGGSFGTPSARLSLLLDAQRLEAVTGWWGHSLSGSAQIHAVLGGTIQDPLLAGTLNMSQARWVVGQTFAVRMARVNGFFQVVDKSVATEISADQIQVGDALFNQAGLSGSGSLQQHVFSLRAQGLGASKPVQAQAEWAGSWQGESSPGLWRGQWRRFDNQGRFRMQLLAPAALEVSAGRLRLNNAHFQVADGRIHVENLQREAGQWRSRGRVENVSAQALARWFPALSAPRNTLTLGGAWDMTWGEQWNGQLRLARERGDVWPTTVSSTSLGLETLEFNVSARDGRLQATFAMAAQRAGQLQARLSTELSQRDGRWGWAGDAPLQAQVQGELSSLAWLGLLTDIPFSADGRMRVNVQVAGTWAGPELQGELIGERLTLRTYQPRATLQNGRVRLTWENGILHWREFHFQGRNGQLTASGSWNPRLRGEQGVIQLVFEQLDAITDPLYKCIVSGSVQVAIRDWQSAASVRVLGRLQADQARLTLRDTTAPALGADVVVTRSDEDAAPSTRRFPIDMDLRFELGRDFQVVGYGAEAQLQGVVQLEGKAGNPLRALGTVQTVSGKYYAYGQALHLQRGYLSFNGPIDNPAINFYAQRENLPVDVGVEVSGTLLIPRVRLVSNPVMSSTEKIAWLALGRGLDATSRNDLAVLSLAASALLDRGEGLPLNQRIAQNIGLDDIGVRGGAGLEETIVSVGKRLSKNLYLTIERSVSGASTLAKLRYEVARRWQVQALTGTESALDVFFTFSFD